MSLDTQKLVMLIKKAAVEAVNAKDPMNLKIGEVVSVSPLKISINQKINIPSSQLLLTNAVRDYTMYAAMDGVTENESCDDSGNAGGDIGVDAGESKPLYKLSVQLGLKPGEKVILLRCDGGQKFIVLDRVEAPDG